MDIRFLGTGVQSGGMSVEAYTAMALRQKRKEAFYRSILRAASVSLLFMAAGCFTVIYIRERGGNVPEPLGRAASAFDPRRALKELFLLSLIPTASFALCFPLNGLPGRLGDTLFPALYGVASGGAAFMTVSGLADGFTLGSAAESAPYLLFVLAVVMIYTLICSVCASFARCRSSGSASYSDGGNCFVYYLASLCALCVCILLRDASAALTGMFH